MSILGGVCNFGKGELCCKYLTVGVNGFGCVKLIPDLKTIIDNRTDMTAKGDNCDGRSNIDDLTEDEVPVDENELSQIALGYDDYGKV